MISFALSSQMWFHLGLQKSSNNIYWRQIQLHEYAVTQSKHLFHQVGSTRMFATTAE